MSGIEQVIPYNVLKMFTYKEVGRYLAGAPTVDSNCFDIQSTICGNTRDMKDT